MNAEAGATRGRGRLFLAVPLLVFLALAAILLVRLFGDDPSRLPSALIGKQAPSFELPRVEGLTTGGRPVPGLSSADLKGQVTVVNVFASWCAPCRDEHPLLMRLASDPSFRLVGIDYKDAPENARRFLGGLGNPFAAVGSDFSGRVAIDFGVYGVPETFVIAPGGAIAFKHVGPLTEAAIETMLRPQIEKARAASPGGLTP